MPLYRHSDRYVARKLAETPETERAAKRLAAAIMVNGAPHVATELLIIAARYIAARYIAAVDLALHPTNEGDTKS